MNILRVFLVRAVAGFALGFGMMLFGPLIAGIFPVTWHGVLESFGAIHWPAVWFVTGLFAITWTLFELRFVQAITDIWDTIEVLFDLLTFWRR